MSRETYRKTKGRQTLYSSVVDTIGDTPCIRINRLAPDGINLYVKAEFFNPAGSVKDRLAISIIEEAELRGALKPGQTVVEATSGNTGIGLAMVCAAKGYPLVVTMADSFSIERRKLMRFLGAKVVLTPRAEKGFGMYNKAKELADANGWFLASQFETPDNAKIHENTTAQEILSDFTNSTLDYFRERVWNRRHYHRSSAHITHPKTQYKNNFDRARRSRDHWKWQHTRQKRSGNASTQPPSMVTSFDTGMDPRFHTTGASRDDR
jgi:hypothetical protein